MWGTTTSEEGWVAEHGKQAAYDRSEADQYDEKLEKLCKPRFGTKSVDGPEQYCPDYDCNKNSDDQRNHAILALLKSKV